MTVFCQRGVARCEGRPPLMDPARPKFIDKFTLAMHVRAVRGSSGCMHRGGRICVWMQASSGGFMVSVSSLLNEIENGSWRQPRGPRSECRVKSLIIYHEFNAWAWTTDTPLCERVWV